MKKAGYIVVFCMTVLFAVLLSGCAQGDHTSPAYKKDVLLIHRDADSI